MGGFFTRVGDFFRGAFGEDDQERKRRKQREAQEAAARKQAQPKQNQGIGGFFKNSTAISSNLSTEKTDKQQKLQQQETQRQTQQLNQSLRGDKNFLALSEGEKQRKTGVAGSLSYLYPGKSDDYERKVKADRQATTNKDKYVAAYDKMTPEYQKILVNQATEKAKKGDKAAINTLNALKATGRLKGDAWDFIEGYNDKLFGGTTRGLLRAADFVLPGKNTWNLEKNADKLDPTKNSTQQFSQSGKAGETTGTGMKAGLDIATLMIPQTAIDKGLKGVTILEKLNDGSTIARYGGRLIRLVPGSVAGSTIDALQQVGRGDKVNAPKAVGTGLATDVAIDALPGGARWIRRLFGKTNAEDVIDDALKQADNVKTAVTQGSRVADDATPAYQRGFGTPEPTARQAYEAERSAARGEGKTFRRMQDEGLNPGDVNDIPAYQRRNSDEVIKDAEDELADVNKQLDTAPEQAIESYKFREQQRLAEAIRENPEARDALIANYQRKLAAVDNFDNLNEYRKTLEGRKAELEQLIADQKVVKEKTDELLAKQADEAAKTVDAQQAATAEVQADQAARTAPAPGEVVQEAPTQGSPELQANQGTRQSTEDILYGDTNTFQERGGLSAGQRLSPDRLIRERVTRPIGEAIDNLAEKLQTSNSRFGRFFGRGGTGFSRELGVDAATQTARMQLRGGIEAGKVNRQSIADLGKGMTDEQLADVWATIDTEYGSRLGKNISVENLSPEQQALRQKLVDIRDNTTVENMRRGLITKEQAANGDYINRDYSVFYEPDSEVGQFERGFRGELLNQYKGRKQVSDELIEKAITDPTYLVGKKQAQSEAAWAMQDYGNYLAQSGKVVDQAQPGYVQLPDTPLFGDAAGKFVPRNLAEDFTGFQYDMAITSAFNDMITAYDRLGIRQAKKQLLTIFNPAVRLGNQVTNRGIFSQLSGINPVRFNIAMQAAKDEMANQGQLYREAVQQGLTGVDITQAEFFANRIAKAGEDVDKNIAKKALDWARTSYSGADDQARVAAYMVKRQQGYDPVEAARQVQRGFQDYKSVGFFYDMAAKTPIIGNAFVRFAADSMRIAKNAAVDHPLRTLGTIAAWSAFTNGMSVLSGESTAGEGNAAQKAFNLVTGSAKSEAQKERENRFGAPKLPFTNISAAVQTPFGEVNVARFMPWYSLNDIDGGSVVQKMLPLSQLPFEQGEDGKFKLNPQAMNDPLLGQFVQLAMDEDFRGKSIRDPKANGDKYAMAPLSGEDQLKNVARFLFNNNGGREIDQLVSAATGNPDIYGKDRNIWQALARDAGFKIEQQGAEQAKDRASMKSYIEDKAEIDKQLEGMSPGAQEAWKRLTGYYKLREQVPNEFEPGETRDKKAEVYEFSEDKWKDFAAHPELYKLMVDKKKREFERDGKPIPPEFDERLSDSFRTQILQNKMVAPGDDAELDQRMYSTPEWDYYMKLKDEYKKEASKYYPESDKDDFDDETVKYEDGKFPEKPDILKAYSAAYKQYADGQAAKPQWNDALTAAKEAYNRETLQWTNTARKARGLPAITWDVWDNPTFGFDSTPSGGGFGFGRGGGGGGRDVNTLTELTNFSNGVKRYDPVEAQAMPNAVAIFQKLMAPRGGGRAKPKLGASSSGR